MPPVSSRSSFSECACPGLPLRSQAPQSSIYRRALVADLSRKTVTTLIVVGMLLAIVAVIPVSQRIQVLIDDWRGIEDSGNYETSLGVRIAMWHIGLDGASRSADHWPWAS
jgi:hypothetical protein